MCPGGAQLAETRGLLCRSGHGVGRSVGATIRDPEHSAAEQRFLTLGMTQSGRVVIVAHTDRGGNMRIISARCTTRRERKFYEENG